MKQILLISTLGIITFFANAQAPAVIKAVASTVTEPAVKDQEGWKSNEWNGLFFYQGTGSPTKLCVTDGTNAGTKYLADIGAGSMVVTIPAQDFMYIITNRLVSFPPFIYEAEIWKSDGTTAGTSLVKTMPQISGTSVSNIWTSDRDAKRNFSVMGNTMFFGGYDAANGVELWKTDGTNAGTVLIKDINTAGGGSSTPMAFNKIGTDVFFTAIESVGRKLWKTDGTAAGTTQIAVAEPFFILDNAVGIVNNKMIFYAHNTMDGYEPYVSDGTAAGTFMLLNINAAGNSWINTSQNAHLRFNGSYCFFVANNGTANALWRTDGTSAGTIQLTTNAQAAFSGVSGGSYTDVDENGLWMIEYNTSGSGNNEKLYRSDGTVSGTYQTAVALSYAQYIKIYKGALWMASRNTGSPANTEPWRSGGNAATTNKAFEIAAGSISANPFGFFVKNDKLYFFASSTAAPDRNLYQYTGDFTFNGNLAGGNWKDSANWNGLLPPGITDSVFVNAGTPNALNVTSGTAYAGTLTLGNNATINFTNATDSLIINKAITAGANNSFTGSGVLALKNINTDSAVKITNGFTANQLAVLSSTNLQNGNVSVTSNLNIINNSLFSLNNNNLTLSGTTSTISQTGNSYINTNGTGKLTIENIGAAGRTGAVNFPVGTTANYNPVLFTNSGTADNFSIRVQPQVYAAYTGETGTGAYTSSAVDATWFITEAVAGGSNADIMLQWNAAQELPGFNRAISQFGHYTGSWQLGTATVASGVNPYTVAATGITSFSPFAVLNSNATLPLHFISFTAQNCNNNTVCLNWKTENELNVSHFEIERSIDGRNFTVFKNEIAKNQLLNSYVLQDDMSALQHKGIVYYRIRQVDLDGKATPSGVLNLRITNTLQVNVFPNPVKDVLYITNWSLIKEAQLVNMEGKRVMQWNMAAPSFNAEGLPAGIYQLQAVLKNGNTITFKMIKI